MSASSTSARRLAAERRLAQLGRAARDAERGVDRRLVGGVRQRARAPRRRPPSRSRAAAPCRARAGSAASSSTGTPSTVTPSARALRAARSARRSAAAPRSAPAPGRGRAPRRRPRAARTSRASAAGRRPSRRRAPSAMPPTSSRARGSSDARAAAAALGSRASASRICASSFGPTPGTVAQAPGRGRLAELLRRAHAERPRDLDRAPGGQPEVAAEPDQPGRELALELGQLRDLPGLQQLPQPRLDPGPDPAQLLHAPLSARACPPAPRCRGSAPTPRR